MLRILISLALLTSISFACLCQSDIEQNVQDLETQIVDDSHEPTQEALEEATEQVKEEQDALEKEIKEIKAQTKAQNLNSKEIKLATSQIKKENELLEKLIELEGTKR